MTRSSLRVFAVTSLISVALVASMIVPAKAQDTISLYGDIYGWLSRFITTTSGLPFDIVVQGSLTDLTLGAFPRMRTPDETPDAVLYR